MDPFSFFPPKYCRVRGVHYTRVFWVRRLSSTPLRKLWVQCQRVATSLSKVRNLGRRQCHTRRSVILNTTHRGLSPHRPGLALKVSRHQVMTSMLLRHSPIAVRTLASRAVSPSTCNATGGSSQETWDCPRFFGLGPQVEGAAPPGRTTGGVSPGSRALGPTPETPQNRPPGGPPRRPPRTPKKQNTP